MLVETNLRFELLRELMLSKFIGMQLLKFFNIENVLALLGIHWLHTIDVIDKTWAADLYLIYKLEPKASVCISDKDRMRI